MFGWILFARTYIALGALSILFSNELAATLNKFSLKFYGIFPVLKKRIPLSRLAGRQANYRSSQIFCRLLGTLMLLGGALLLGKVILHWH